MLISRETADYVAKCTWAIDLGKGDIPLTDTCPECEEKVDTWEKATWHDDHIVYATTSDTYAILVGCEGYWVINPTLVGLPLGEWHDADGNYPGMACTGQG